MKEAEQKADDSRASAGILIERAKNLDVPIDDLLTADGEEIAWKADRDFHATINGVLIEIRKDEPIRDWPLIIELRKGRCPVTSLEAGLLQRLTTAQAAKAQPEVLMLKPNFHGIGVDLKQVVRRISSWWRKQRGRPS
jgi:hypothetical protein